MAQAEKTVMANSGFGEMPYTKSEYVDARMKPVYDTITLLLSSDHEDDKIIAKTLSETGKRLAEAKFERLYALKNKTEADATDLDPSTPASSTDELNK